MVDGVKRSVGDTVVIFRSDPRIRQENRDSNRHMPLYFGEEQVHSCLLPITDLDDYR